MDPQQTWNECKSYLSSCIPPSLFETFIQPISVAQGSSGLTLLSPANPEAQRHIETRYLPLIEDFLQRSGYQGQVQFDRNPAQARSMAAPASMHGLRRQADAPEPSESPDNESKASCSLPTFYPAPNNRSLVQNLLAGALPRLLVITGASGSGKTHLGRLLVARHMQEAPANDAAYLTLETFLSDFSMACRKRDTVRWRSELRKKRLIVLDDFHFLKPSALKASEELQNLIDDCQETGRFLVLLSHQSLSELRLPEALSSRLRCFSELTLEYPCLTDRIEILKEALAMRGLELSEALILFLAERISRDMRLLKSVPDRLLSWQLASNPPRLDEERLRELAGDLFTKEASVDPARVLALVSEFYRLPVSEITGTGRQKGKVLARHLVAWLCTEELGMSQKEAAALIGRTDHGSVIHARKRIAELLSSDIFFAQQVSALKRRLFEADSL